MMMRIHAGQEWSRSLCARADSWPVTHTGPCRRLEIMSSLVQVVSLNVCGCVASLVLWQLAAWQSTWLPSFPGDWDCGRVKEASAARRQAAAAETMTCNNWEAFASVCAAP